MKFLKIISLLASFFLLLYCCNNDNSTNELEASITFVKTYGGDKNESAQSVAATLDGGYAVLGYSQSNNGDITDKTDTSFDYWVLKFDSQDTLQWQKTYGGTLDDKGKKIIQTNDGGFAIIGSSQSSDIDVTSNNGSQDYWVAKLDALGNITWQKSFGFTGNDEGISIIQTSDLGYLLTGVLDVSASGGEGNTSSRNNSQRHAGGDYWAIKIDAFGNLDWSRYFGGNFTDTPEGVVQLNNGSYIIAGGSDSIDTDISNNIGTYDFWVVNIAANGDLIWEKSFGGDQSDEAKAIVKTNDGNLVVAGETRSNNGDISNNIGAADIWIIKINPDGNLLWEKTLGGTSFDVARNIKTTKDNSFVLTGSSRSNDGDISENKGQNDAWAVKLDSNANIIWEFTVGGSNIDVGFDIVELNDNAIITVGETASNNGDITENKGFSDLLIFKIN